MPEHPRFHGVYPVLVTPFHEDGTVDWLGVERVVDFQLRCNVAGVVCFGLASEGYKLSDGERTQILDIVARRAKGRIDIIAGAEHASTEVAAVRASQAESAGATALMLFPPSFVKPDARGIVDYYATVAAAAHLPIIIQDAPAWTGLQLTPALLREIAKSVPAAGYVKVEAPPTASKIGQLRDSGIECVGGYGTLYLAEELDRGVVATMPGCGFPRAYTEMLRLYGDGCRDDAEALFNRILPLTVFAMSSLDIFVALHKRILWKQGLIASPQLRRPAVPLDTRQLAWMDRLTERVSLDACL